MKYEKILPQLDGDNFAGAKEFRFSIPAQSEFFTRYYKTFTAAVAVVVIFLLFLVLLLTVTWSWMLQLPLPNMMKPLQTHF